MRRPVVLAVLVIATTARGDRTPFVSANWRSWGGAARAGAAYMRQAEKDKVPYQTALAHVEGRGGWMRQAQDTYTRAWEEAQQEFQSVPCMDLWNASYHVLLKDWCYGPNANYSCASELEVSAQALDAMEDMEACWVRKHNELEDKKRREAEEKARAAQEQALAAQQAARDKAAADQAQRDAAKRAEDQKRAEATRESNQQMVQAMERQRDAYNAAAQQSANMLVDQLQAQHAQDAAEEERRERREEEREERLERERQEEEARRAAEAARMARWNAYWQQQSALPKGRLNVTTDPAGAQLTIEPVNPEDGGVMGGTFQPVTSPFGGDVTPGRYQIVAKLQGRSDVTDTIDIASGQTFDKQLKLDLTPPRIRVKINGPYDWDMQVVDRDPGHSLGNRENCDDGYCFNVAAGWHSLLITSPTAEAPLRMSAYAAPGYVTTVVPDGEYSLHYLKQEDEAPSQQIDKAVGVSIGSSSNGTLLGIESRTREHAAGFVFQATLGQKANPMLYGPDVYEHRKEVDVGFLAGPRRTAFPTRTRVDIRVRYGLMLLGYELGEGKESSNGHWHVLDPIGEFQVRVRLSNHASLGLGARVSFSWLALVWSGPSPQTNQSNWSVLATLYLGDHTGKSAYHPGKPTVENPPIPESEKAPTTAAAPAPASPTATQPAATTATWATTAKEQHSCPRDVGKRYTYVCPANGSPGVIYGSDPYTHDSSICTAAVHAGRITAKDGGTVTIEIAPGQKSYPATPKNGVTPTAWNAWDCSYVFR